MLTEGAVPYDIVILSNGPGELATWVKPVVTELRRKIPQARLSLLLTPCPHASGHETRLAKEYIGIDRIQDADFFWSFLLTGRTEEAWDWAPLGVVLFLGGDQFYTLWVGQLLGYRTVVYAEIEPRWRIWIHSFGVRTEQIRERYGRGLWQGWRDKMVVVGDLMVDGVGIGSELPGLPVAGWAAAPTVFPRAMLPAVSPQPPQSDLTLQPGLDVSTLPEEAPLAAPPEVNLLPRGWRLANEKGRSRYQIAILPGSKPAKLSLGVPMGLAIADEIRQVVPNVQFVMPIAPTQTARALAAYAQPKTNQDMALVYGTSAVLEQTSVGSQFVTPFGTVVALWTAFPAYSVLANCDLCITTVGANTAELARLGLPMVVLIPTNKLEAMRAWDGILGLLVNLPLVGGQVARLASRMVLRSMSWLAWPNIWAQAEVVPELRGHLRPVQVAGQVAELLQDPVRRQAMREQLLNLSGKPGAAERLVELVIGQLAKAKPRFRRTRSR